MLITRSLSFCRTISKLNYLLAFVAAFLLCLPIGPLAGDAHARNQQNPNGTPSNLHYTDKSETKNEDGTPATRDSLRREAIKDLNEFICAKTGNRYKYPSVDVMAGHDRCPRCTLEKAKEHSKKVSGQAWVVGSNVASGWAYFDALKDAGILSAGERAASGVGSLRNTRSDNLKRDKFCRKDLYKIFGVDSVRSQAVFIPHNAQILPVPTLEAPAYVTEDNLLGYFYEGEATLKVNLELDERSVLDVIELSREEIPFLEITDFIPVPYDALFESEFDEEVLEVAPPAPEHGFDGDFIPEDEHLGVPPHVEEEF